MKCKLLTAERRAVYLEDMINQWIEENPDCKIVSLSFSSWEEVHSTKFCAVILYEEL